MKEFLFFKIENLNQKWKEYNILKFLIFCIGINFFYSFFKIKLGFLEFGMSDSWAMWSAKARYYTDFFLLGKNIILNHPQMEHANYPNYLPMTLSGIGILLKGWDIKISYGFHFFFAILFLFTLTKIWKPKKVLDAIFGILIFAHLFTNFYFLEIASDLCADFLVGVFFAWGYYYFLKMINGDLSFTNLAKFIALGSVILGIKNEGQVLFAILVLSLFIFLFFEKLFSKVFRGMYSISESDPKPKKTNLNSMILLSIAILLFMISFAYNLQIKYGVNARSDFQLSIDSIFTNFQNFEKIKMIYDFFSKFHVFETNYSFLIFILLIIFFATNKKIYPILPIMIALIFYNVVFLFSSSDLSWHLNTAYYRINSQLFPTLYLATIYYSKNISEKISAKGHTPNF